MILLPSSYTVLVAISVALLGLLLHQLVLQYSPTTANGYAARNGTIRHATASFSAFASDYSALTGWPTGMSRDI